MPEPVTRQNKLTADYPAAIIRQFYPVNLYVRCPLHPFITSGSFDLFQ